MSKVDWELALEGLSSLAAIKDEAHFVRTHGAPKNKSRPRFSRGRVHSAAGDVAAERNTGWALKRAIKKPFTGNVAIACIFYRPNRQRIDVDNLLKHVLDAATGIAWVDDSQVTAVTGRLEYDADNPRTLIAIAPHMSSLGRGTDDNYPCSRCGEPIGRAGRTRKPIYCSKACRDADRTHRLLPEKVCEQCSTNFTPKNRASKLCSEACRREWMRGRNQAGAAGYSRCMDCGTQLSHNRGGRCRECWRVNIARKEGR